jgi:prophage tail gpP-like protein
MRLRCVHSGFTLELDVENDATVTDVLERIAQGLGLQGADVSSGYVLVRQSDGTALAADQKIGEVGLDENDSLVLMVEHQVGSWGETVAIAGTALAAGKVAVDAARVRVDAHRARTERMQAELEREKFEAEQVRPEEDEVPPE